MLEHNRSMIWKKKMFLQATCAREHFIIFKKNVLKTWKRLNKFCFKNFLNPFSATFI